MITKISISSLDKSRNEQKRFIKYLKWGDSFAIALQEISEGTEAQPEYICLIRNKDGEIVAEDRSEEGVSINGENCTTATLKNDDMIWLSKDIQLTFKLYEVTGKDIFRSTRSSKEPIVIKIPKKEEKQEQSLTEVDYSNPVGQEIDGYYFEDVLNYGNMGIVYKGLQRSLKRPVAIKTVSPKSLNNPTIIKRFMNMAKLAWRLNHPYIVQIYDTGMVKDFDMNYVVMEHVEGDTLREVIDREKNLEIEYTCKIMSQLASALSFAHRQNIIHRDVNPTNVIITKDDYIKLIGLALSKIIDPDEEQLNLTLKGQSMGMLGYISPEQARSAADVDFRTDIYSLGVMFYECLTGSLPYDAKVLKDPNKYVKVLRSRPKKSPHQLNPLVPDNLSKIVMKCLEPNPDKRYQKSEELLDDIKLYTETMQLSAAQKRIRAMFPKTPIVPGYEFNVVYEPMAEIGGDFYDFVPIEDGKIGITIGDVTGHGIEGAVVMGMVKSIIKLMAKNLDSAADVLEYSNKEISPDMDSTTFTTVFYGILDTNEKTFQFARAGHNPLILYNYNRTPPLTTFAPKGSILGVPWSLNCQEIKVDLQPGDIFIQYTDGIIEAHSAKGEEFGLERLCELVEQTADYGVEKMVNMIKETITKFSKGSQESDDITLIVLKVKE